jgi:hypothetical protein
MYNMKIKKRTNFESALTLIVDLGVFIPCFTSSSKFFHLYWNVTIAGEGLQNLGLCLALRAFEQGGFLSCHMYCDRRELYRATPTVTRGLGFSNLIRRTASCSRLLRHVRGYRGPILIRILTGWGVSRNVEFSWQNYFHDFCILNLSLFLDV